MPDKKTNNGSKPLNESQNPDNSRSNFSVHTNDSDVTKEQTHTGTKTGNNGGSGH
jgi:hypothetical protein